MLTVSGRCIRIEDTQEVIRKRLRRYIALTSHLSMSLTMHLTSSYTDHSLQRISEYLEVHSMYYLTHVYKFPQVSVLSRAVAEGFYLGSRSCVLSTGPFQRRST